MTVNILKRHLDQALQGGRGAQGLGLFCKFLGSKTQHLCIKTLKYKNCFSPEPIYSNSNAMFFVEEKGSKFQVLESIKEKAKFGQLSNISKMLYFDKFDCFRWTRWSPLEQWWLNTLRLRESPTSSMSTGLTSSNVSHQDIHNPGNLFGRKNLKRQTIRSLTLVEVKSSDGSLRGPSSPEQVLFPIFVWL